MNIWSKSAIMIAGLGLALCGMGPRSVAQPAAAPESPTTCDPTLWSHVYAGDPRKFTTP